MFTKHRFQTAYNPFRDEYEVLEYDLSGGYSDRHQFKTHDEAVTCKRQLRKHDKLFSDVE